MPTDETPLQSEIEAAATEAASTSAGGTTVSNRSISELVEGDKHLAGKAALSKPRFGMMVRKIKRGGALG